MHAHRARGHRRPRPWPSRLAARRLLRRRRRPTDRPAGRGARPSSSPPTTRGRCRRRCSRSSPARPATPSRSSRNGDAGQLTNKLVLTKGSPIADMAYGIDNTFASRAVDEGVLADYTPKHLPASAASYALDDADEADQLTPVDYGDVCVNVDDTWFREARRSPRRAPSTTSPKPAYKGLFVTPGASTSSPGLAFLLATIAKYGDGWPDYWKKLMANGAKVTAGLVGRLRGRLHRRRRQRRPADRAVLRLLAAVHDPQGRQPADHQRAAGHLLPPGGVRRRAEGRGEPRRRQGVHRLHAAAGPSRRRCRTTCTSSRSTPA